MTGQSQVIATATRHAVPRRGYVLSSAVEELGGPSRRTVADLRAIRIPPPLRVRLNVSGGAGTVNFTEDEAWHLISICLVAGQHLPQDEPDATDCIRWFYRDSAVDLGPASAVLDSFVTLCLADEKRGDLLPYIIDAHGPGSRLSVRKAPETSVSRARKKAGGVFYTPADVAEYMSRAVLSALLSGTPPTVLDPAVGTGVFLRAALTQLRHAYPTMSPFKLATAYLYGADIDPFALNGAAFVLLFDVAHDLPVSSSPAECWIALRNNLAQVDGLLLDRDSGTLAQHFPALAGGADVVIGNPPYAPVGERQDLLALVQRLTTLAVHPKPAADLYPIFVEQMVRLAKPDGSGAMVVPLSLACNGGRQFRACRELIENTPGLWRMAFFDREPHALFGEDVKTRNTIIIRNNSPHGVHRLMTGPLRRWRGVDRDQLLSTIGYTDLGPIPIAYGVPKVDSSIQAAAVIGLQRATTLGSLLLNSGKTQLSQLPNAHRTEVLVGPTAYNFLNIARATVLPLSPNEALSENALHRLMALDEETAAAVYALLATDFAFWWWYVHGDGFHVNLSHLLSMPIGDMGAGVISELSVLGRQLWFEARRTPVKSSNKSRVTFSFPTREFEKTRGKIIEIQTLSLGLGKEFVSNLDSFVSTVVGARLFPLHKENVR